MDTSSLASLFLGYQNDYIYFYLLLMCRQKEQQERRIANAPVKPVSNTSLVSMHIFQ